MRSSNHLRSFAVGTAAAVAVLLVATQARAQCLNPTHTPSVPVTSVNLTSEAACDVGSPTACNGGVCSPDYTYYEWEVWNCYGIFGMVYFSWTGADPGLFALCLAVGGVPFPYTESCNGYNTAHCSLIRCGGAGQCPLQEFCAGDGVCHQNLPCTSSAQCGEYVCIGGFCARPPADLTSSISVSPATPYSGQTFTVSVTIRNSGSTTAPASTMSLQIGGETYPPEYAVGSLAPGASRLVTRSSSLPAGRFLITALLDIHNDVDEGPYGGESNNKSLQTLVVTQ